MTDAQRVRRNITRLRECWPPFSARVVQVIETLESKGFRPRIQDAWRSPDKQREAFEAGHSKLMFGFHNATAADGITKESLAVDLLNDDAPLAPDRRYLFALASAAVDHGLVTGILWGLRGAIRTATTTAVSTGMDIGVAKIGWDPTHLQTTRVTVARARRGSRPWRREVHT